MIFLILCSRNGCSNSVTKFAASVAGTLAAAAYLDAKYLLRHDLSGGSIAAQAKDAVQFLTECWKQDKTLMYHVLEAHARGKNQDNIFLIFEGRSWSYKQFFEDVHGVGNWLVKDLGVERGELVALDGGNSPEYLLLWFGLESIAACPSFINCNLTAAPLVHCVKLCGARYLLADRGTEHLVQVCEEELKEANIQTIYYDSELMSSFKDKTPTPDSRRTGIGTEDLASLIYTSGRAWVTHTVIQFRRLIVDVQVRPVYPRPLI